MHARATGDVLLFFLSCMSVLWEGFDWVLPIFHCGALFTGVRASRLHDKIREGDTPSTHREGAVARRIQRLVGEL